jgi:hypothetical protein
MTHDRRKYPYVRLFSPRPLMDCRVKPGNDDGESDAKKKMAGTCPAILILKSWLPAFAGMTAVCDLTPG